MTWDGILYNITKKEYIDYDICHQQHNWEANVDLLLGVAKLLSSKWVGCIVEYARETGSPDDMYSLVCFGDPYDDYKTEYKKIALEE